MRAKRKGFSDSELCPTPKTAAGGFFTALTPAEDTTHTKFARPAMDLQQISSTNATWVPAWQLSDDGENWPSSTQTPQLFNTSTIAGQNTEQVHNSQAGGSGFEDISPKLNKKYVRWGIWAVNNAGQSAAELAQCAIRIDKRSC